MPGRPALWLAQWQRGKHLIGKLGFKKWSFYPGGGIVGRPCQVDSSMIRVMMGKRSDTWSDAEKCAALSALFDRQNKCVLFKKSSWLHTWPGWVVNLNMLPVTLGLCGYVHLSFDLSTHICFVKHLRCPASHENSAGAGHKIEIEYTEKSFKIQSYESVDSSCAKQNL